MEAKFRCDSAYTRELIQEFYEYCCFRRPRYIVYHIIFALALAFWLYVRLSGGTISYFIPIAVLVYYGLMLCYYYASVNLFMKRSRELTKSGVMQMKMAAYSDRMEFFNGSGERVLHQEPHRRALKSQSRVYDPEVRLHARHGGWIP